MRKAAGWVLVEAGSRFTPDDARWLAVGFDIPARPETPERVQSVALQKTSAGSMARALAALAAGDAGFVGGAGRFPGGHPRARGAANDAGEAGASETAEGN